MSGGARAAALLLAVWPQLPGAAGAAARLLYLEAQGIGGFSSAAGEAVFHSMAPAELMQKPSAGIDYVQRFAGAGGDFAAAALQVRLAVNADTDTDPALGALEPQVYNAWVKYKAAWADIWAGHSRPSFGLSADLDSHALLLPPLAMFGYGFDRDWGAGVSRAPAWGGAAASLTTGSGAPLRVRGNWMAAARLTAGVPNRDNWSAGASVACGRVLKTMGYHVDSEEPGDLRLVGADVTWLRNRLEHRLEALVGRLHAADAFVLWYRAGWILDGEDRLRFEVQPLYQRRDTEDSLRLDLGATARVSADVTVRAMVTRDSAANDTRLLLQLYYYAALLR